MVKAKEQTFRSPGFFDREIDLSQPQAASVGKPGGIIGTAPKGPAFVPVTLANVSEFDSVFGGLDPKYLGTYGAYRYLENATALSYMRVLGAGSNDTVDEIETTRLTSQVANAGFVITGTTVGGKHEGCVQFLVAKHTVQTNETLGMPIFTDNDSFTAVNASDDAYLVRAMIFNTSGSRFIVLDGDEAEPSLYDDIDDLATLSDSNFKLILSSTVGTTAFTASLNPSSDNYIGKILNTNPEDFATERHLLYLDMAVDDEVATVSTDASSVAILSGSANTSDSSGNATMPFRDVFGHFDTRFQTGKTTYFISQPFGTIEYDLFYFEALDDGAYPNNKFKVSIADIRGNTDPRNEYGTFSVLVRNWNDTDQDPQILERFTGCTLDPTSDDYVARKVGDTKTKFLFDADSEDERRLVQEGKYPNNSARVRIVMNTSVENKEVPATALPFGFRGFKVLKTNDLLTDAEIAETETRIGGSGSIDNLSSSIIPPLPYRFKVTRGDIASTNFAGDPGVSEEVDGRLFWGVKLERNKTPLNSNITKEKNKLSYAYSKMMGLQGLDSLVTGTGADDFNENKFTLARVAFSNTSVSDLTGTAEEHIIEAAYIRNANPDSTEYKVTDGTLSGRVTLATLANLTSSVDFNRFQTFNKFTNIMAGGFDGLNILDKNAFRMNDKGSSSDTGGGAAEGYLSPGLAYNPAGTGKDNNAVFSYRTAAKIMTDPLTLSSNGIQVPSIYLLAVPGIKDSFITDYVANSTRDFGLALYIMDIPSYDDSSTRLYGDEDNNRPSVSKTAEQFDSRAVDNSYAATYFPDVFVNDDVNNRVVKTPASVAAMSALAFNDKVGFPWFAPAGFNRGALSFVRNLDVRLTVPDRNVLYDARINPIANFPRGGYAIFGQKTLLLRRSALDRVNVRRLLIEVKRVVSDIAINIVFENNTAATRARFVNQIVPRLGLIQAQAGIERFDVIADERNNTVEDDEQNRMNGKIVVVPTRTIEFISVDFVITNAGVSFDTL